MGGFRTIGRYELHARIAAGGMGAVHLGCIRGEVGFRRAVAIKRMHAAIASDPASVAGFIDEARLTARLRHPNVVSTLDVVGTDDELIIVMDYVHGESLAQLARSGSSLPIGIAVAVVIGALHGLHAAHEARDENGELLGLVHRDVSPQNILVGADGVARVADFGVAKASGKLATTKSDAVKGKIAYMAPEQLAGLEIDRRADVFSMGVVLWELLTGERLFLGANDGATVANILRKHIEPPSVRNPVAADLDAIVLRALERDPDARFESARAMARALESTGLAATSTDVAEWVERRAAKALAERAAQVAEIERTGPRPQEDLERLVTKIASSTPRAVTTTEPEATREEQVTSTAAATVEALPRTVKRRRPKRRTAAVALLVGIVGFVLTCTLLYARHRARLATARPPQASSVVFEEPPAVADASAPEPSAIVVKTIELDERSAATSASARAPARPPRAPPARPPSTRPRKNCADPYTRDELGRKIYKRECLVE